MQPTGLRLMLLVAVAIGFAPPIRSIAQPTRVPTNERHEELKHKADDAYRTRDFATAVTLSSQVLAENSRDAVALYLRASSLVEQGIAAGDADLVRKGIEDARAAIRNDPAKKPDYYLPYLYGMSHLTRVEKNPSHAETAESTAGNLLVRPDLEPDVKANVLYQRGVARASLENHEDAVEDFRRAIELSKTHLGARMALSDALLKAGDVQEAVAALDEAVTTFPSTPVVFNNRGMFHQSQGKTDLAIQDFTQALSLDPDYVQAYLNRGFTLIQSGDAEGAIGDFNAVLDRQPQNAAAYSLRGTARLRHGDIPAAIEDYQRSTELNPASAAARADLGFAHFFDGDYEAAAEAFDQSLAIQPDNEFLQPWRYTALVRSGREDAARSSYESLKETPREQQSWFDALTLLLMGELTEDELIARVESRDARLKDAQICEAYYFIGVSKQQADPEAAAAYFRRALRSDARQLSAYQAARIAVGEDESTR